jgi:hypothetical protein
MEIGPLPAIRAIPVANTLKEDPGLTSFLDVEQTSAPKEDTFSRGGEEKMSGGQDGDQQDQDEQKQPADEASTDDPSPTVNLFA